MLRIVWGVLFVVLGAFLVWQAFDSLATAEASNLLMVDFYRSMGQRAPQVIDAYKLSNFWSRVLVGGCCLSSGSLLIYFGDVDRKSEIHTRVIRIEVDDQAGTDW